MKMKERIKIEISCKTNTLMMIRAREEMEMRRIPYLELKILKEMITVPRMLAKDSSCHLISQVNSHMLFSI